MAMPGGAFNPVVAFLARRRVTLGFLSGGFVFVVARPSAMTLAVGAAVAAIGELLRVWAAGHLNKGREVTSSGPYRWLAHPLYVGSSVIGVGLAVAAWSGLAATLIVLYLGVTLTAAIGSEEARLRREFEGRYDQYKRGGVVPLLDEGRRFSFARAFANREHRAVIGLLVALLLLALRATYNGAFWRVAGTHVIRPGG
jgi:protein-S-isoprenylcysteine O-methyltransferase Ste14